MYPIMQISTEQSLHFMPKKNQIYAFLYFFKSFLKFMLHHTYKNLRKHNLRLKLCNVFAINCFYSKLYHIQHNSDVELYHTKALSYILYIPFPKKMLPFPCLLMTNDWLRCNSRGTGMELWCMIVRGSTSRNHRLPYP